MLILITFENYNESSPGAIRNKSFVETLAEMKHNVVVLHKGKYHYESENIVVKSLYHSNKINKLFFFNKRVLCNIKELSKHNHIDGVLVYSPGLLPGLLIIRNWCIKNNIPIIFDVVEWYSKEQFKNPIFSLNYHTKNFINSKVINKQCRVIAISRFLEQYFSSKGIRTTRIPIIAKEEQLVDPKSLKVSKTRTFIYAGSHFEFDNLPLIVKSLALIPREKQEYIRFNVFGFDEKKFIEELGIDIWNKIKSMVIAHGRKTNIEVLEAYKNSDFCILFRDSSLRVNKAGFPSKSIESMSQGIPLLCNYSSDLVDFIRDGYNSIVVDKLSPTDIALSIERILNLKDEELLAFKERALNTIKTEFIGKVFINKFKEIIS